MALTQGQINELLKVVVQHDLNLQDVICELLKNPQNENYVMSYIRSGLMNSTRFEATVNLLQKIILNFSKDVLHDHLISIAEIVLGNQRDFGDKFKFLEIALRYVHSNEVSNKTKIPTIVVKIIEKVSSMEKYITYEFEYLSCLAVCLEFYPSTCGTNKNKSNTESFLTDYLTYDKSNKCVIEKAAKCFHYLQKCGLSGINSINHTKNWTNAFTKIILTIKECLVCLKNENYEFAESNGGVLLFPLGVDNSTKTKYFIMESRLESLLCFLKALIELKFSAPKVLKPELMINLLEMCNFKDLEATSTTIESYILKSVYERIEIQFLYVFRSFIAMLRLNLIPFSNKITKILLDKLNEKHEKFEYKNALYKLIGYFISVLKNNVHSTFHKRLIDSIMNDIELISNTVTLNYNVTNVNLKKRQKLTNKQTIEKTFKEDNLESYKIKENICCSALDCLKICFVNLNLEGLGIDYLKNVYKSLSTTLNLIQNGKNPPPYISFKSIGRLYGVIVAALEQSYPPSLPIVINLLKVGQMSGDKDIFNRCHDGLMLIEKICQPVRPHVYSTIEDTKNKENGENRINEFLTNESERNVDEDETIILKEEPNLNKSRDEISDNSTEVICIESKSESFEEDMDLDEKEAIKQHLKRLNEEEVKFGKDKKVCVESELTLEDMLSSFNDLPNNYSEESE